MAESYIVRKGGGGELEFTDELYPIRVDTFSLNNATDNTSNFVSSDAVGIQLSNNYVAVTNTNRLFLYHKSNLKYYSNFTLSANTFIGKGTASAQSNDSSYIPIFHSNSTNISIGRINHVSLAFVRTNVNILLTNPNNLALYQNTLYVSGHGWGQRLNESGVYRFPNVISDINNYTFVQSNIYGGKFAINDTNIFWVSGNSNLVTIEKRNASTFQYLAKANLGSVSASTTDPFRIEQVEITVNNGFVYAADRVRNKLVKHHESNLVYVSEVDLPSTVANFFLFTNGGMFVYNNLIHIGARQETFGTSPARIGLLYHEANLSYIGFTSYGVPLEQSMRKENSSEYIYTVTTGFVERYTTNAKSIVYKDNTYITIKK